MGNLSIFTMKEMKEIIIRYICVCRWHARGDLCDEYMWYFKAQ